MITLGVLFFAPNMRGGNRMYHSITLGTKNTWDDCYLIPTSRPVVNPPSVKTNMIEIPGGDGVLDLTTALAGRVLYKNRTGA